MWKGQPYHNSYIPKKENDTLTIMYFLVTISTSKFHLKLLKLGVHLESRLQNDTLANGVVDSIKMFQL